MILATIEELYLGSVQHRGIPNRESIALKAQVDLDLGRYGIMVGFLHPNGIASPQIDRLFWFGDYFVSAGDWIFVYTGSGTPKKTVDEADGKFIHLAYWGSSTTLFANSAVVPILFRTDFVSVGKGPADVSQENARTRLVTSKLLSPRADR